MRFLKSGLSYSKDYVFARKHGHTHTLRMTLRQAAGDAV